MKKINIFFGLVFVIVVILFLGFVVFNKGTSITYGENLVINPGMEETSLNDTSLPLAWIKAGQDSNHLLTFDNTIAHSGEKSLQLEVINSTKSWYRWQGDNIYVEPGAYYYVEYWYKSENIPIQDTNVTVYVNGTSGAYTNAPARAMLEWSEFDGINPNRYATKSLTIPWKEGNTDWTKMSSYIQTGLNTTYISPRFFLYSYSGRVWFDDLSIRKATENISQINYNGFSWKGIKGVGIHGGHYNDVTGMKELGVDMIRDDITWTAVETTKGVYNFNIYDNRTDQLLSQGIKPLYIIDYSNCLYNGMPSGQGYSCTRYVPRDSAQFELFKKAYGDYVYAVVSHFKGKVKYFELWNEPNGFWQPKINDEFQALQYIELMKEGYVRAKQANPDSVIVSAGISVYDDIINKYITNYYVQGAKDYFDILALHPYCSYDETFPKTEQGKTCNSIENIAKVKAIMDYYGDSNKKIWITEFGYPTEGCYFSDAGIVTGCAKNLNEENQNIRIVNIISTLRNKYPYITAFFWYDYKDDCGSDVRRYDLPGCFNRSVIGVGCPVDVECRFGLVRNDLTRKPAYDSYKKL